MKETKTRHEKQEVSKRLKIVCVMGGSNDNPDLNNPLGELIAGLGFHLLTGAGGGVMAGVSKAFFNTQPRKGLVIGVIRANEQWSEYQIENVDDDQKCSNNRANYNITRVNQWVEFPIYTHLGVSSKHFNSRNHINVLTSDVVIALPGGNGTNSEIELAL